MCSGILNHPARNHKDLVRILLGFIPIMMPFLAVFVPLIAGVPFMLYLTKARKFGMLTIMGMILGIIMITSNAPPIFSRK